MDEDHWYALSKSQQSADWQEGFDAAKAEYVPVLMKHLQILADIRAGVEALPSVIGGISRTDVLALFDGSTT